MNSSWLRSDIEAILLQLNSKNLPFKKYSFVVENNAEWQEKLCLIGEGASALVFDGINRKNGKACAIKVIGFGNQHVDSEAFLASSEVQVRMALSDVNVVKLFAYKELEVKICGEHKVIFDEEKASETESVNTLSLQFLVMEKVTPIVEIRPLNAPVINCPQLMGCEEEEVLHLAKDIAFALQSAHRQGLIHRDVKLENIFYSTKRKKYKIGDFGIAKMTEDGMAYTVAFTKGYGAPEVVGTLEDRYDYTADIYSLGMVLYVLMNHLRFPGSNNYHPCHDQYRQGFVPEAPDICSTEFARIILKMIAYDPDDRYQSMEEVLNDLDGLLVGERVKYYIKRRKDVRLAGWTLILIGGILWKYLWLGLSLILFAIIMLSEYTFLDARNDAEKLRKFVLLKGRYWFVVTIIYFLLLVSGLLYFLPTTVAGAKMMFGESMTNILMNIHLERIGLVGFLLSAAILIKELMRRKRV